MQDHGSGLRRISIPRTRVNKGKKVHGRRRHRIRLVSSVPCHDAEVITPTPSIGLSKRRSQAVTSSVGPWSPQRAYERPRRTTTADIPRVPFNSASRPGTPPTSGGPRPAREPGWRRPGTRGRPCPEARAARSADADDWLAGTRGAARPRRTPAAPHVGHPARGQTSRHQTTHCFVDERFCAGAKSLS